MASKKIVIFSEDDDFSTSVVMKWILTQQVAVERVNKDDRNLEIVSIMPSNIILNTSYGLVELNKNDVYWFRRAGYFSFWALKDEDEYLVNEKIFEFREKKAIFESVIHWIIANCKIHFSDPFKAEVHKVDVLNKAQECGINIPDWTITNNRTDLMNFIKKNKYVAIKAFSSIQYSKGSHIYKNLTNKIDENDIQSIPQRFSPVFCQKYIEKKYELRIFYFNGTFFSMAILSQKDEKTKVDFRDYDKEKPNRRIPFDVPELYLLKLKRLAKILDIDTGSFDVLVDDEDNYYFLEVNTVGQFGMVSHPCNFHIEQYIAQTLINSL